MKPEASETRCFFLVDVNAMSVPCLAANPDGSAHLEKEWAVFKAASARMVGSSVFASVRAFGLVFKFSSHGTDSIAADSDDEGKINSLLRFLRREEKGGQRASRLLKRDSSRSG
eukprot:3875537-Rhodomonas_salina.2